MKPRYWLFVFALLAITKFLNPFGVISSPQAGKFMFYLAACLGMVLAMTGHTRLPKGSYPRWAYIAVMFGIVSSVVMVYLYQDQSLSTTVIATLPYFFGYLFFYILMKLNIDKRLVLKTVFIMAFVGMVAYLVNAAVFPSVVFGSDRSEEDVDMTRGIARLSIPYFDFIVLLFFYAINQWISAKKNRGKWMIIIALTSVFILLSVTRQKIGLAAVLGLWFIMVNASMWKRILVVVLCAVLVFVVIPQIPFVNTMIELTETQSEKNKYEEEDIRIQAWRYYTIENQTNAITPIFGNGIAAFGKSDWGRKFESEIYFNRCFYVDVGWAGFFYLFGGIATVGLLILLFIAAVKRKRPEETYLSYWMVFTIITSIASAPILYYSQIFYISTVLYLIYGYERNESYGSNNSQLQ